MHAASARRTRKLTVQQYFSRRSAQDECAPARPGRPDLGAAERLRPAPAPLFCVVVRTTVSIAPYAADTHRCRIDAGPDVPARTASTWRTASRSFSAGRAPGADGAQALQRRFGFHWFYAALCQRRALWHEVLLASLVIQLIPLATPLFTQSTLIDIAVGLALLLTFSARLSWLSRYLVLHTGNRVHHFLLQRDADRAGGPGAFHGNTALSRLPPAVAGDGSARLTDLSIRAVVVRARGHGVRVRGDRLGHRAGTRSHPARRERLIGGFFRSRGTGGNVVDGAGPSGGLCQSARERAQFCTGKLFGGTWNDGISPPYCGKSIISSNHA